MSLITGKFDISEHLKTDEDIQGFLHEVAETGNVSDLIHALNIAARAKGISEVAIKTGVTRDSLYKSLSENGNPGFETIINIVKAFGCRLAIVNP